MKFDAFQASVEQEMPPDKASLALQALWHAAKGDWETAHKVAQGDKSESGAWVHAYLHRVEGDLSNAGYWYRKVGRPQASNSLQEEWREIATALL
ncbi:MAG: hypothetical protein VX624_15360 [Pseudomonadota bacterium]|nr:hypothetical protein [Pseudomonadota bacterium]MED5360079.1 hypothetical protein [Pseudomonadota bacterium]MED6311258.1 hypothetical protein [Pseudomonadota bacterium]